MKEIDGTMELMVKRFLARVQERRRALAIEDCDFDSLSIVFFFPSIKCYKNNVRYELTY